MNPRLINQYRGVNPHLQGYLLAYGKWLGFHNALIVRLAGNLDAQISKKGYRAELEPSLQIYRLDEDKGEWYKAGDRHPDVGISSIDPAMHGFPASQTAVGTRPTWEQTLSISEETELSAISIQTVARDKSGSGRLVAWIELLSPANKPGGSHYDQYMIKREKDALGSGCVLVEIDYLHQQLPISPWVPSYGEAWSTQSQSGVGKPYYVLMEDPRLQDKRKYSWYSFGVEETMPVVTVPLLRDDDAYLELGKAYDETLRANFAGLIDYLEKPPGWETYLPGDQDRIAARIETICEGMKDGRIREGHEQAQPLEITVRVEGARHRLDQLLATLDL